MRVLFLLTDFFLPPSFSSPHLSFEHLTSLAEAERETVPEAV
jgi:hypothetical protein